MQEYTHRGTEVFLLRHRVNIHGKVGLTVPSKMVYQRCMFQGSGQRLSEPHNEVTHLIYTKYFTRCREYVL